MNFDDIKKLASLPTRTLSLCLAGEVVEEIAELERQLADAKPATNLGEASPKRAIAEKIVEAQARMREASVDFKLRAMPARAWNLFWAKSPERKDGESAEDWDARAFPWYAELVSRTCIDPEMTVDQVGELVDVIHGNSWLQLGNACQMLNMGEIDIPNSDAASELIGDSEQT